MYQNLDVLVQLIVRPVASGIEVKILFVLLSSAQKDCNEKPARTPNVIKLRKKD